MKKICKKCAVTISVISSRINNDVRYGRDRGLIKTMTTEITATATNEKRIIATSTEVGVQVNRGEKTKNLKYAKSAKYPLELVKVILWIYIDTVDDDTDMKMVSGHIAGSTNLGNGVVLVHRITNLCQKLAAMGVKSAIPATVVDD